MKKINIIIEREAISSNDKIYGVNKRGSRHLYKNEKTILLTQLHAIIGKTETTERKAFKISRYWGKRKSQFDEANLIGGFKIFIDCLTELGHLKDDNPDYFKGYYSQQKSSSDLGYIELIELDPQNELKTAFEGIAKTFEISSDTLLRVAKETKLTKDE